MKRDEVVELKPHGSKETTPVILNAESHYPDDGAAQAQKTQEFIEFIDKSAATHCQVSTTKIRVSRKEGVCLASQVELLATKHNIEDGVVIEQFDDQYYIAEISGGLVSNERFEDVYTFNKISYARNNGGVYLGNVEFDREQDNAESFLREKLRLKGAKVKKHHYFYKERKSFGVAGISHPKTRKIKYSILAFICLALILGIAAGKYQKIQEEEQAKKQAQIIPPKIGRDDAVFQLRTSAQWLSKNIDRYVGYGASTFEVKGTSVKLFGLIYPQSYKELYRQHRNLKVLLKADLGPQTEALGSNDKTAGTWTLNTNTRLEAPRAKKFGYGFYEDYLTVLTTKVNAAGMDIKSNPPATTGNHISNRILA